MVGPVRVVVPGYIGGRSAKWVTAITVQDVPSQSYFQALDYRTLPAQADPDKGTQGEGISLSSPRVNCDILVRRRDVRTDGEAIHTRKASRPRVDALSTAR